MYLGRESVLEYTLALSFSARALRTRTRHCSHTSLPTLHCLSFPLSLFLHKRFCFPVVVPHSVISSYPYSPAYRPPSFVSLGIAAFRSSSRSTSESQLPSSVLQKWVNAQQRWGLVGGGTPVSKAQKPHGTMGSVGALDTSEPSVDTELSELSSSHAVLLAATVLWEESDVEE